MAAKKSRGFKVYHDDVCFILEWTGPGPDHMKRFIFARDEAFQLLVDLSTHLAEWHKYNEKE